VRLESAQLPARDDGTMSEEPRIWIKTVSEDEAEGLLAELYANRRRVVQRRGRENRVKRLETRFKTLSIWPKLLAIRVQMERELFFRGSTLGARRREMVTVVAATLIGCHFWASFHGESLRRAGLEEEQVEMLRRDYRLLDLERAERAMLDYAAVLTAAPWRLEESHVQTLRGAGWNDRGILEINQVCAFMNMLSRTTRGLGGDPFGDDRGYERDAAVLRNQIVAGEAP
jgi:uncharacterized peroxidase-related enzyme